MPETAVREKPKRWTPLLMRDELVIATMAGRKTQTRRTRGLNAINNDDQGRKFLYRDNKVWASLTAEELAPLDEIPPRSVYGGEVIFSNDGTQYTPIVVGNGQPLRCPYGTVGDCIWVREGVVQIGHERTGRNGQYLWPKFDDDDKARRWFEDNCRYTADVDHMDCLWDEPHGLLNKMFMPKWASRLSLELTEIRLQKLHEITESDAKAEGVIPLFGNYDCWSDGKYVTAFEYKWNDINGWNPNAYQTNPYVFALTFKVLQ